MDDQTIDMLFNFYTTIKKTKLYEWVSIAHHIDCVEFLKYKENY